jgi:hypothetical protein
MAHPLPFVGVRQRSHRAADLPQPFVTVRRRLAGAYLQAGVVGSSPIVSTQCDQEKYSRDGLAALLQKWEHFGNIR